MASEIIVNTIKAPTTGANANKVIIPSGVTLTSSNSVVAPNSIVQTVQVANSASSQNSSPGTWADTNYQISITPTYATSKVEFIYVVPFRINGTGTYMRGGFRVYRDISGGSSSLVINNTSNVEQHQVRNATNEFDTVWSGVFIDDPSTTSQVTYRIQSYQHPDSGANFIQAFDANIGGNLILREIAQ